MKLLGSFAIAVGLLGCSSDPTGGSRDGRKVYDAMCATCHGPLGKPPASMAAKLGVKDLSDPTVRARLTAASVERQVLAGSANKLMPSFSGALTDAQIAAVAAFVVGPELMK